MINGIHLEMKEPKKKWARPIWVKSQGFVIISNKSHKKTEKALMLNTFNVYCCRLLPIDVFYYEFKRDFLMADNFFSNSFIVFGVRSNTNNQIWLGGFFNIIQPKHSIFVCYFIFEWTFFCWIHIFGSYFYKFTNFFVQVGDTYSQELKNFRMAPIQYICLFFLFVCFPIIFT